MTQKDFWLQLESLRKERIRKERLRKTSIPNQNHSERNHSERKDSERLLTPTGIIQKGITQKGKTQEGKTQKGKTQKKRHMFVPAVTQSPLGLVIPYKNYFKNCEYFNMINIKERINFAGWLPKIVSTFSILLFCQIFNILEKKIFS
jgi:hypothetical protein